MERNTPVWTASEGGRPQTGDLGLEGDRDVDVVVVGGGAAGLSIALRLLEEGLDVLVLERHRVGEGVTGGSTAKVTALHGTLASQISRAHGVRAAQAYVDAQVAGLDDIRATIERYAIDCDLTDAPAVNYATTAAGQERIEHELATSRAVGLPVDRHDVTELPFPVTDAMSLAGQAQLHPVRWCQGLAAALGPGRVIEHTTVTAIDEGRGAGDRAGCTVTTADGATVRAGHAVIATHAPIVDPRYLTVRCRPERSYVIAARARADTQLPEGMHLSVDPDRAVHSVRAARIDGTDYLLVGGEGHPVADERDARHRLDRLENWAGAHFDIGPVEHRWAAHDQVPSDGLPFIGRLTPGGHRWVATGFQKWGLTTSAVAATIVADGIRGREGARGRGEGGEQVAVLFDPTRLRSSFTGRLAADVGRVAQRWIGDHVEIRVPTRRGSTLVADLEPGDGVVVPIGRGGCAVHRDAHGKLHTVSAVCTHEGCLVRFNRAQTTWDCPCHGSRFDIDGQVLTGPAVDDLPPLDLP
jgi:glycine/D-amino acid oxidase-like deaminating enzyme/nitrite reductase/ring-hydroxylating ferredoxin subunit